MTKRDFNSRLNLVNKKIDRVDKDDRKHTLRYFMIIVVLGSLFGVGLYFGTDTGNVVFSEDVIYNTDQEFFVVTSKSMELRPPLNSTKTFMISGEVFGSGKAEVYLMTETRNYLVYYFEGNAAEGKGFENMCIETCNVDASSGGRLLFKLDGVTMRVDNLKYVNSQLMEFELEPEEMVIDYKLSSASAFDVTLTNPKQRDFDVLLYLDGPLSEFFSWQGSLIHMSPDDVSKEINVKVRLPSGLAAGEYPHKITARYVPPGDKEFIGSAPVDEMIVVVKN